MTAVAASGIHLWYGEKQILQELSLTVNEGDFFVLIGPNGAGKTSLLNVLAGLVKPGAGEIEILGKSLRAYSRKALSSVVAVVPQQLPTDFPFTVADTVLMGRAPHLGLLGIEQERDFEIAREAMTFTDVKHLAHRRLDQLSGGERQRVIIAKAICQQPRIILLDEPTASLDPAHQTRIMDLMERFRREQRITVVMVSHDLNLAALYADRLLLMKEGTIAQEGLPRDVLTDKRLKECYGCDLMVDENPLGAVPRVTPVPEKFRTEKR